MAKINKKMIGSVIRSSVIRGTVNNENEELSDKDDSISLAPYDNPPEKKTGLRRGRGGIGSFAQCHAKNDILDLSPLQTGLLNILSNKSDKDTLQTIPVFVKDLACEMNISVASLKKAVQRLEKKGFIQRVKFKQGRGGWTVYQVAAHISTN